MSLVRTLPVLLVAAALATAACVPASRAARTPAPAVVTVPSRPSPDPPRQAVPDVADHDLPTASATAAAHGLQLRAVVFEPGARVTTQYPPPGGPLPPHGELTVWLGTPPLPPPRKPAAPVPAPSPQAPPAAPPPAPAAPQTPLPPPPASPPPPPARRTPLPRTAPAPGLTLRGPASWYGQEFAAKPTACRGIFDPAAMTLATRELACGTRVRVTGPDGRSVVALANDWGPAEWTGRRFDLSAAAFAAIHDPAAGVVEVTVEVVG